MKKRTRLEIIDSREKSKLLKATAKTLKLLRIANDLTTKELSRRSGFSSSYISEVESNIKSPSLEMLKILCETFNIERPVLTELVANEETNQNSYENPLQGYQKLLIKILEAYEKNT